VVCGMWWWCARCLSVWTARQTPDSGQEGLVTQTQLDSRPKEAIGETASGHETSADASSINR